MTKNRVHRNKIDFKCANYYEYYKSICTPEDLITQALHTKILKIFAKIIMRKIVHEMYKFRIPGLGLFYLTKVKIKIKENEAGEIELNAPVNWPETRKVRALTGDDTRRVVYLNDHTNGYVYKVRWKRRTMKFINKDFYSFIAATEFRKFVSNSIKESIKPLNAYAP